MCQCFCCILGEIPSNSPNISTTTVLLDVSDPHYIRPLAPGVAAADYVSTNPFPTPGTSLSKLRTLDIWFKFGLVIIM